MNKRNRNNNKNTKNTRSKNDMLNGSSNRNQKSSNSLLGNINRRNSPKFINNKKRSFNKNIKLSTGSFIDENKYEIIDIVMGVSIRSISSLRQFFSGIASIFGGRRGELEKKLIEAREEAIMELLENANKLRAERVMALHIEMSELSSGDRDGYLIVSATGTCVKRK